MKRNYFKVLLTLLVLNIFSPILYAQGRYINLNMGYGWSMSSQNISFLDFFNKSGPYNNATYEQIDVSFGKGLNGEYAYGYMFNKNIGAEFGISYLFGGKYEAKDKYNGEKINLTLSSKMLRIKPAIVIASGFEKINPYVKVGMVLGYGSFLYGVDDRWGSSRLEVTYKFKGGLAVGLFSGAGAIYSLNKKVSIYGELNMVNLSYAPTKGEIIKISYGGTDKLMYLTTKEKVIEFVDVYDENKNMAIPVSQPSTALKQRVPFGSFGLNLGFRFNLK
jgi:hypothetical protein